MSVAPDPNLHFSEKDFYLAEFRGRTLGLVLAQVNDASRAALRSVLGDLDRNHTRSLLISREQSLLEELSGAEALAVPDPDIVPAVWRGLRARTRLGLAVRSDTPLAPLTSQIALALRLAKLVWIDEQGGLLDAAGERLSFLTGAGLDAWLTAPEAPAAEVGDAERGAWLREVHPLLKAGFPALSLCSPQGLGDELFTYAGSGSFFTRESYTEVRRLGLDEFEAAHALVRCGIDEGYLLPRSDEALGKVLAHAFGVFVGERHLAGLGALLPHPAEGAGEIASLYTLTRFKGEGVGGHLLRFAADQARSAGWSYVFACTTSERVKGFFLRNGFAEVGASGIPESKWRGYDAGRRTRVHCLRCDL